MIYDNDTKNKILTTALDLFAEKGYSNVTIREIAKHVGIKGSSIYNHFSGKEDILSGILEYQNYFNEKEYDNKIAGVDPCEISKDTPLEMILEMALTTSLNMFSSEDMIKILKILSQNQLSHPKIREHFINVFLLTARQKLIELFSILIEKDIIQHDDPEFLAYEFHSFQIYSYYENYLLLENYVVTDEDTEQIRSYMIKHIQFFCHALKH
ncbi:TetR/AcrR family transcriptional regulator [Vallitalea pronyensis]|uniref:TetR/AcrR family transcriptional regulator n=1 Tax=Vallitalea pronyensis TaxID=1348613 RepID=A0A8J8MPU2_9FIRM|nr:TetR/AcrR family transcriptional regulator [Vallitalea pronyensis]QUI25419.1 TetR/AcrR family transcriptional regulator [Vallitalea pronyensis]